VDVLEFLGEVGRVLLRVFIVIAPLLAWQWAALWGRSYRGRAGGLADPTVFAGMMVGIAILAVILPLEALTWDAIVSVGGFWDLDQMQFVKLARSMVVHGPGALLDTLIYDDERRDLQAWLALAFTLWAVRAVAVWIAGPPKGTNRFLLAEVATFLASVIGTVYLGPLVLWSINRLNFWLLLIVILLIQDYRYDEPPIFSRLVGAVSVARYRHRVFPPKAMPVPDPD
jgi:hypothetical protein